MLHSVKSATRNIVLDTVLVSGIVNLPQNMWPVATKGPNKGEAIPKSLLRLIDGSTIGVFTRQIKNTPVAFPKEGIECNVSYENGTAKNRKGDDIEVSNVLSVEFNSKLAYIVGNAKAVAVASDMN